MAEGATAPAAIDADRAAPARDALTVVAALFVAGLVFRVPILVVGPLLKDVQLDLGMSHGVAGLLSSIPVL